MPKSAHSLIDYLTHTRPVTEVGISWVDGAFLACKPYSSVTGEAVILERTLNFPAGTVRVDCTDDRAPDGGPVKPMHLCLFIEPKDQPVKPTWTKSGYRYLGQITPER
jgi:hypothetical protein